MEIKRNTFVRQKRQAMKINMDKISRVLFTMLFLMAFSAMALASGDKKFTLPVEYYNRVQEMFNAEQWQSGKSVLDAGLKQYPDDSSLNGLAGKYCLHYEDYEKARFFLVTIPDKRNVGEAHAKLLYEIAKLFEYTYVVDLYKYAPDYNEQFRKNFFLAGHMNVMGYKFTADMVGSYIDYIIRNNMEDFKQIGFVGTDFHNCAEKW